MYVGIHSRRRCYIETLFHSYLAYVSCRRLQNLLNNSEENMRTLTNKLNALQEFDTKAKKFFGENEDFFKKKATELTKVNQDLAKRLEESEKARMEKVLEENDSSKVTIPVLKKLSQQKERQRDGQILIDLILK